ncbi:CotH kinase family protein [Actinoplanes sp. NPDC051861]|uniref:CotH kinase family protein n=1 Tax=Actinoplanes sp. NPDC051861 TaxID=3155170 RepID=UPI0034378B54
MTEIVLSRRAFGAALAGVFGVALLGACGDDKKSAALFDDSAVHDIGVAFEKADYDAMIATYLDKGDKDWIEATVTIDGSAYAKAGLRLKGNSSLREVSKDSDARDLPWLVRLDKYTEGQSHQGYAEFVVRSNRSQSALNEAVALDLLGVAGLATQKAVPARFGVNGGDDVLRLVIENPGDKWDADHFPSPGILYKAEADGDYSYRGADAASYADVFDQETGGDSPNLAPLIAFLQFINSSDDATFGADLGKHLDVAAFATYLAFEELVANSDDIDGPGNNSYLRYTTDSGIFTVVAWDHNLAFGGMGGGGGPGGPGGGAPGVAPSGAARVAPSGAPDGAEGQGAGRGGRNGGPGGRSNILVQRFQADTTFKAAYEKARTDLKAELYTSGRAATLLSARAETLKDQASDLVSTDTVTDEAAKIETYFSQG